MRAGSACFPPLFVLCLLSAYVPAKYSCDDCYWTGTKALIDKSGASLVIIDIMISVQEMEYRLNSITDTMLLIARVGSFGGLSGALGYSSRLMIMP